MRRPWIKEFEDGSVLIETRDGRMTAISEMERIAIRAEALIDAFPLNIWPPAGILDGVIR